MDLWWFVMCPLQRALLKRALCTSFWESQLVSVRRGSCCVAFRETAGMGKLLCKPTGNVPAIIPQKVSFCKALSEAGIFDFWRRQCLWPLLHAARTRNLRNIHFLILSGVSLQELWLPMQLSSLHWGSSAWSAALHQRLLKLQKSNYFQDPSWIKLAN